jgi:hypothetical protein
MSTQHFFPQDDKNIEIINRGVKNATIGRSAFSYATVKGTITRADNATQYTINDIVNGDAATVLIPINFGGVAGQTANIRALKFTSTQAPATSILQPALQIFNTPTLEGVTLLTDNTALSGMTAAQSKARMMKLESTDFGTAYSWLNTGTGYEYEVKGLDEYVTLDVNGYAHMLILAKNAYTPKELEVIEVQFAGYLL